MRQISGPGSALSLDCNHCTSEEECEPHVLLNMMHGFFFVFPLCTVLYSAGVLTFSLAFASPLSREVGASHGTITCKDLAVEWSSEPVAASCWTQNLLLPRLISWEV